MSERRIAVFAGPSLPPTLRPRDPAFEWLPPAGAGDALLLFDRPPDAVCLIDGFFEQRPAPWHKELLGLMARGVALFGAASMGALRAAELHGHGMVGVGAIFRAYRDGLLTGDDEVACLHAPEPLGWAPLTLPMVEVRATLAAARRHRVIDGAAARAARDLAHDIHFTERDWPSVEQAWSGAGLVPDDVAAKVRALHVPLKRMDALACLVEALGRTAPAITGPAPPWTCYLDALAAEVSGSSAAAMPPAKALSIGEGKG